MGVITPAGRVAVIIPVYRAQFLAEALDSVFFQSRPPAEVIVVDDGSPDRRELTDAIAPYRHAVRLIRQDNQGAAAARNAGLAVTAAEFVALLDADDRWQPHFLRDQLAFLAQHPHADLVCADGLFIGRTPLAGRTFSSTCRPSRHEVPSDRTSPFITLEALLRQEATVLLSSVVSRRRALVDSGGFDPAFRRGHDFELWLRMAARGMALACQPAVLVLRREHDDNLSGADVAQVERPLAVLEHARATLPLTAREYEATASRIRTLRTSLAIEHGKALLREGDVAAARRAFADVREGLRTWKVTATRLGLLLAPSLVRRLYLARLANAMS